MENVDLNLLYEELRYIHKKIDRLEEILIPEEEFPEKELNEIDKLRSEALEEHKKGQTIRAEDIE